MSKLRWASAAALAAVSALALGTGGGDAARFRSQANLVVRIAAAPRPPAVGANLTYTVTVRNAGPHRARNVVVHDLLPAHVAFVSASASQGSCAGGGIVTCALGALPRGATASVAIVAKPTQNGRIVNLATVHAAQPDRAPWNNRASLALMVGQSANLGLSVRAVPRPATIGLPLTYVLTVRNLSAGDATGVVLTNRIPARSTLVSAASSQGSCSTAVPVTCSLGTVAGGASAQITIVVQPAAVGYLSNRAVVNGDQADPYRFNNSRTVTVRVRPAA